MTVGPALEVRVRVVDRVTGPLRKACLRIFHAQGFRAGEDGSLTCGRHGPIPEAAAFCCKAARRFRDTWLEDQVPASCVHPPGPELGWIGWLWRRSDVVDGLLHRVTGRMVTRQAVVEAGHRWPELLAPWWAWIVPAFLVGLVVAAAAAAVCSVP